MGPHRCLRGEHFYREEDPQGCVENLLHAEVIPFGVAVACEFHCRVGPLTGALTENCQQHLFATAWLISHLAAGIALPISLLFIRSLTLP